MPDFPPLPIRLCPVCRQRQYLANSRGILAWMCRGCSHSDWIGPAADHPDLAGHAR